MSPTNAEIAAAASVPLTRLAEGRRAVVTELLCAADPAAAHLVAVGVLPGAEIRLVQRYPSYIFEIGHTEFAVDEGLAARIMVRARSSHPA
jgi:DtxR family transcriptional regulator, Mn-dependent transcriptional regulator